MQTNAEGDYLVVAEPKHFEDGTFSLIKAVSCPFAEFLKKAQ